MVIRNLIIIGSILLSWIGYSENTPGPAQSNNPPQVKITAPVNSALYAMNALVPYAVTVSDKEDGESKFGEIASTEVFLELRYFSDAAKSTAFINSATSKEDAGYSILKKQDCFNCHANRSKLIGPSFSDISHKYRTSPDIATLTKHIIKGSTGVWGTEIMPTHPSLSDNDARQIIKWILSNGSNTNVDYIRGAEGAVRLTAGDKTSIDGVFVLKATYTDHGVNNNDAATLTGADTRIIRIKK